MAQITGGSSGGGSGVSLPAGVENGVLSFVEGQYVCTDAADLKSSSVECTGSVSSASMTSENLHVQNVEGSAGVVADETGINISNTDTGKSVFYSENGLVAESATMTGVHIKAVADADPSPTYPLVRGDDSRLSSPVSSGLQSSRPTAGVANRIYIPTDGHPLSIDSGSAWYPIIDGLRVTPPPAVNTLTQVGFTADTTLEQDGDGWLFTWTGDSVSSSKNIAALRTIPVGAYTLTVGFETLAATLVTLSWAFGLCVTDGTGATPKSVTLGKWITSTNFPQYSLYGQHITLPGTWNATPINIAWPITGYDSNKMFMRLTDDETNLIITLSIDGRNWYQLSSVASVGRTAWLTPTHVGLFFGHGTASVASPAKRLQTRIFHWEIA